MSYFSTLDANSLLGLEAIAAREAKRRAARTSLIDFTEYTYGPRYKTAAMHREIAAQLERAARGEIDRLMLLVPPRLGKSELSSRRLPAWLLGRFPDRHFISVSASATLAEDHGRDVRNIIASPEYQEIFPDTQLAEDSQARGRWRTAQGGSYFACGVGGALYGRGAHFLIIDDCFGSIADARSETVRKQIWDWYTGSAYNRLEQNGVIIVINHRTHTDDLSGRLLAQEAEGGDHWTVVEMKALGDDGTALWPERLDVPAIERIRAVDAKMFSALYQQSPIVEVGGYFSEAWIKQIIWPHGARPPHVRCYGASDFAVTSGGGDYTVHVVVGVDTQSRLHLLDMYRAQASPKESVEAMCDMIKKWKPAWWSHERGHIVSGLGPYIETRMRQRQAYCAQEYFVARHDKAVRSQSIRGRMELGGLYVRADAPWVADLKAELLAFPDGRHDDIVDALGLVGQIMDRWSPAVRPKVEGKPFSDPAWGIKDPAEERIPSFMTL
jgi:predicted phage terminase large subunit-like protein